MPSAAKPVRGRILTPSYNFTRPADTTAYASGDLVANNTTAASVVALSWSVATTAEGSVDGFVRRVRMYSDDSDTTSASFRIHFYRTNPCATAPTNGDNGALAVATSGINASYLGSMDVTWDRTINTSDAWGVGTPGAGSELNFTDCTTLYALIEARAAYTPASGEVLTVVPEIHLY